jgi:hypothetical protein
MIWMKDGDAIDDKIRLQSALFVLICILVYLGETLFLPPHRPLVHTYLFIPSWFTYCTALEISLDETRGTFDDMLWCQFQSADAKA